MKGISLAIALLIAGLLAACGSIAQPAPMTAQPTATVSAMPTGEAQPAADGAQGNPALGRQLFTTFQPRVGTTCTACHRVDSDERLVGPGLLHVGERAATRSAGMNAATYLHTSIVSPSAFVVDGYPDIMPKNWSDAFTEAQLNDLVAFLLSLSTADEVASAETSDDH
ncbi:MAG: cytochrome c [Anaerolineae bacterium]|nr:cytochrome c [Anaerolineae bacterium]